MSVEPKTRESKEEGEEKIKKAVSDIIESVKESKFFQEAFTHDSYQEENKSAKSYEVLEFLGDSILNFSTTLFVYNKFPQYKEGEMSKLKQRMVREETLTLLSKQIGLDKFLKQGMAEIKNTAKKKDSILSDIFESFVAALYLEKGEAEVHRFLSLTLFRWSEGKEEEIWDYKSYLQEMCQAEKNEIEYIQVKKVERLGTRQIFTFEVRDKKGMFKEMGHGESKRDAQQEAARKVIEKLKPELKLPVFSA